MAPSRLDLGQSVAVITGGAGGIGAAAASAFVAAGSLVVLSDLDGERARSTARAVDRSAQRCVDRCCDVTDAASVQDLIAGTIARFGRFDVLMNIAGIAVGGELVHIPIEAWQSVLDVNVLGSVRAVQAVLPHMLERDHGWIVNTSSVLAELPDPPGPLAPYVATKSALVAFSRCLHSQLAHTRVGVSVLCPRLTRTDFSASARMWSSTGPSVGLPVSIAPADPPELVASRLVEGLRSGELLISMIRLCRPES